MRLQKFVLIIKNVLKFSSKKCETRIYSDFNAVSNCLDLSVLSVDKVIIPKPIRDKWATCYVYR